MSKICFGCGTTLQFTDENLEGYIPEEKFSDSKYCKRCFRLIHYGQNVVQKKPKDTNDIIRTVNKNAKNVIFLTDFLSVTNEIIDIFKKIRVPKTLIISKSDLIPKNISFSEIREYFKVVYGIKEDILFTSKKNTMNSLTKYLYDKEEIYFLGVSNSGKSTLINALLDKYSSKNVHLATSYKQNTTLDFVRLNIGNKVIIDSPGFVINAMEIDKITYIDEMIKPICYQNKCATTYSLGDKIKIEVEGHTPLAFYLSKNIKIKRKYNQNMVGTSFTISPNSDIVLAGLGFIKFVERAKITVAADLMKYIDIRPSITGGKYNKQ